MSILVIIIVLYTIITYTFFHDVILRSLKFILKAPKDLPKHHQPVKHHPKHIPKNIPNKITSHQTSHKKSPSFKIPKKSPTNHPNKITQQDPWYHQKCIRKQPIIMDNLIYRYKNNKNQQITKTIPQKPHNPIKIP